MYRVLTEEQLLRLHPEKPDKVKSLLDYLLQQNRIWQADGFYCATPDSAADIDHSLLSAVWVLTDFMDRVDYHSTGDYPAKIIFFADNEIYEIVYAAQGKEAQLSYLLQAREPSSRYLVLVDDPVQIQELQIPNANGYCTVSPDGDVRYYRKEGSEAN